MGTAAISFGPKLGLLNNAAIGEAYYDQLRPFLRGMDALVQGSILDFTLTTPPVSPNNGDAYLLLEGATGAWSGHMGEIAVWSTQITDTGNNTLAPGWDFYTPEAGWFIWSVNVLGFLFYNGTNWGLYSGQFVLTNPTQTQQVNQAPGTAFAMTTSATGNSSIAGIAVNVTGTGSGYEGSAFVTLNGYLDISTQSNRVKAATFTIGVDDVADGDSAMSYVFDASSNSIVVTLPPIGSIANGNAPLFILSRNDVTPSISNTVTINASSGNTISGSASIVLANWNSITIIQTANDSGSAAANDWIIISKVS